MFNAHWRDFHCHVWLAEGTGGGSYRVPFFCANSKSKPTPSRILINKQGWLLLPDMSGYYYINYQILLLQYYSVTTGYSNPSTKMGWWDWWNAIRSTDWATPVTPETKKTRQTSWKSWNVYVKLLGVDISHLTNCQPIPKEKNCPQSCCMLISGLQESTDIFPGNDESAFWPVVNNE